MSNTVSVWNRSRAELRKGLVDAKAPDGTTKKERLFTPHLVNGQTDFKSLTREQAFIDVLDPNRTTPDPLDYTNQATLVALKDVPYSITKDGSRFYRVRDRIASEIHHRGETLTEGV